jgi:hypothetical protein
MQPLCDSYARVSVSAARLVEDEIVATVPPRRNRRRVPAVGLWLTMSRARGTQLGYELGYARIPNSGIAYPIDVPAPAKEVNSIPRPRPIGRCAVRVNHVRRRS